MDHDHNVVEFSVEKVRLVNDGRERQKATFYVQNRCSASKKVRVAVDKNSDPVFHILSGHDERYLAAGLKLPVVLQYATKELDISHHGKINVFVDEGLAITVPIEALPPSPLLEVSTTSVEFGPLVAEHQIVTRTFSITNTGTREGTFHIPTSDLPSHFTISPLEGCLKTKETVEIRVELLCKERGSFSQTISILSGEGSRCLFTVTLHGNIQNRKLQLIDCHSHSTMEHIAFGHTYYGTVLGKKAILYNDSPVSTQFLAVLDSQAEGSEHGVDMSESLAMACTPGGLGQSKWREQGTSPYSESLIQVNPAQGSLGPYERRLVEFTFGPSFQPSEEGWDHHQGLPTQRDYALFVKFVSVGTQATVSYSGGHDPLDIAVTATATPVELIIQPTTTLEFGDCSVGYCNTHQIQLCNNSNVLPIEFCCRQLAHYKCEPSRGRIDPMEQIDLNVLFLPRQLGHLNFKLCIDVLGPSKGKGKGTVVYTAVVDLRGCGATVQTGGKREKRVAVAHPNDLATSIRPHGGKSVVITPYTRVPRHTYVDPDYTYNDEERKRHKQHKDSYMKLIRERHSERMWKERESSHSNPTYGNQTDLGMPPARGLQPPKLTASHPAKKRGGSPPEGSSASDRSQNRGEKMLTTRDLLTATTLKLQIVKQCSSKPWSPQIATECRAPLSPEQLSQIHFDPVIIEFGWVVVNSAVEEQLTVKNFLPKHISIKLKVIGGGVHCGRSSTSPRSDLSLILPPHSYTEVPFTLQQSNTGLVERSVEYSINGHHSYHFPVKARVEKLTLTLSTNTLTLTEPSSYAPTPTAGLRALQSMVLTNQYNVPAQFQWHARQEVDTTIFYMMHPRGVVPPLSSLACEFVCQPSYNSPKTAQFLLTMENDHTHVGETEETNNVLTLVAEFHKPMCSFREKRVLFGAVPLNLTSTRSIHLENTGECRAYFQVVNTTPYTGMKVFPKSGCVPVGGVSELKVVFQPQSVDKFDVEVCVDVRELGRTLKIRLAGAVEQPTISIDKELFRFGGVYCGATATAPFTITNKSCTRAQVTFDLSFLSDFSLVLPEEEDPYAGVLSEPPNSEYPGVYTLELPGKSSAQCKLEFCPSDVAAYDFHLPVLVNGLKPPSPPPSPWPPARIPSKVCITHPDQGPTTASYGITPSRRVLATGLRSPLHVSHTEIKFSMPTGYLETIAEPVQHPQGITLTNVGEEPLTWALDHSDSLKRLEDGSFKFVLHSGTPFVPPDLSARPTTGDIGYLKPGKSFKFNVQCTPVHHGTFTVQVPLIVNHNTAQPSCILQLSAEVPSGRISVNPSHITVQPVPLSVSLTAQFLVSIQGFSSAVDLDITIPPMEDHVSFAVRFPEGSHVQDCRKKTVELPCTLEFSSAKPVSMTDYIVFSDKTTGKRKRVPFTVAADNSIFTIYEFLSLNLTSASIRPNLDNVPSLVLQGPQGLRGTSDSNVSLSSASNAPSLSASSTFGDMFLQDCVSAMCRWLSVYGWSEGVKSVALPTDWRQKVGHDIPKAGVKQRSNISSSRGMLVDMLTHLCGRVPPGIPLNLPPCTTSSEKVNQQYSMYSTVITFIKNQGGLLWSVVPESLLDLQDWQQWVKDNSSREKTLFQPGESEEEFSDLSRQAWTHLLMQVVKILVLPRITAHIPKPLREAVSAIDSLGSNVYSQPERVLLVWLNHHYRQQRSSIFKENEVLEREVVNFDVDLMDCTVLACVLAAYCPYLVSEHFTQMYAEPSTAEQCSHNAVIFVQALHDIMIDYDCQPNDLCSPNPVYMILFCGYLYRRLPAYSPKSTVSFQGVLQETSLQKVHLDNPSGKALVYTTLIRGENADDFSIAGLANNNITLARHESATVNVRFHGRHTHPSNAILLLLVARDRRATSGSLAFKLQGSITGARPQANAALTAPLYEPQTVTLEATSEKAGDFHIRLFESSDNSLLFAYSPRSRRKAGPRCPSIIPISALQERSGDSMQLFNSPVRTVHLEPHQPIPVTIQFVPLKMEPRHCAVVLSHHDLGEIVLSITASVKLPYPIVPQSNLLNPHTIVNEQTKTVHLKVHAGQAVEEEVVIASRNPSFEKAVLEIGKWGMSPTELKHRVLSESLHYAALSTAIATLRLDKKPMTYKDSLSEEPDCLTFKVNGNNEYFSLPSVISVPQKGSAVLPVKFLTDEEGQYECHVVLRSEYDVRVVVIESTVMARGRHAELEFHTPALKPLLQEIPLVNPSTVDWPLESSVSGAWFSGPTSLIVKALTTTCYPLTFNPHQEGTVEGELHLVNVNDGSEHVFQLRGIGGRPLAQEHITLHAQAKKTMTHILHVPNHNDRTTVFQVESDLQFISGPSAVAIGGGDVVDYPLTILPKRQGVFSGAVAFVAQTISRPHSDFDRSLNTPTSVGTPHHVWFHVECHVDPAPADHVIPVSCHTLSTTTAHLTVVNPHTHSLTLEVMVEGHGLSGPKRLELELCGEGTYPLTFSPTRAGKTSGRVVFNGSPDGEFWYQVNLTALDPKPTTLPEIKCQLGRTCQQSLELRNPLDTPVIFTCQCTNTKHFIVTGFSEGQVTVDPQSTMEIPVLFKPSALGLGEHKAEISFASDQFGTQVFAIEGQGVEPSSMDPITINANLSSNAVHITRFTNPLDAPTHFSVALQGRDTDHFCLLMKRTHAILLRPGVSLDVPVTFAPESMHRHEVTVTITAEDTKKSAAATTLSWRYPVIGQPELRPFSPSSAPRLACCAKERLEQRLEVSLVGSTSNMAALVRPMTPGSTTSSSMGEIEKSYAYKLVCSDAAFSSLVGHSTGIRLLRTALKEDVVTLLFSIVFVPPKAFSCTAELHVTSTDGGLWRFPLHLSATMATPDDIITVEAEGLNKEAQVGFRLTSMFGHPAPFTAILSPGSDPEISVRPTSGELAAINTRGTLFCISYKPTIYGRNHHAKLTIQSESNEWCYEIIGKPPSYSSPTRIQSRVQHKAVLPLRVPQSKKNFVRENLRLSSRVGVK